MKRLKPRLVLALFVSFLPGLMAFAAPPGTVISNQASLDYLNTAGLDATASSNIVQVTTAVVRSPATAEFIRVVGAASGSYQETVGPSACFQGGVFVTLADPVLTGGGSIDPLLARDVSATSNYNLGEPLFIRLTDTDQNVDAAVIDYVVVTVIHDATGDTETIQLTETGITTGIFTGYLPSSNAPPVSGDCVLQGAMNTTVRVTYTDPADATDSAETSALLDPVSIVFESRTGSPVAGATIEIVEAATGLPATVYGNDGISTFPSLITSGTTEVDSGGAIYPFATGEYRFPVVPPGDYQLIVTPPPDYSAPSAETIASLQLLPGAPFALGPASFGGTFTHAGTLSFEFDIPVDPETSALFLQKSTTTTVAAPGDFIRYELTIENSSSVGAATNVVIIDQLPSGVRFMPGSVTRDGLSDPDPTVSSDTKTLEFDIGTLVIGERVVMQYVIEIVAGQQNTDLVNRATAFAEAGLISNESTAQVRLREDLFRSTATIIGRVLEGECTSGTFSEEQGVPNVRVYLEDGRYAVSDQGGRFHFEDIRPGRHVAQLDPVTVPEYFDIVACETSPAFAGRADSQFVDLSRGSLKRADFYLKRKAPPEGRVDVELQSYDTEGTEKVAYVLKLNGEGNVRIRNLSLMVMLPDGVSYIPGTMLVDYSPAEDPRITGQALNLPLPDQEDRWQTEIRFEAGIATDVRGDLVTKARARFDSPIESDMMTPVAETKMVRELAVAENEGYVLNLEFDVLSAELSVADRLELDALIESWRGVREIQIGAIGHSDSQRIAARNRHRFADNYVLSQARARSAASYVADALHVAAENIQVEGRGPDDPVADNATAEGRQKNRRVEMIMSGMRPIRTEFLQVVKASSGTQIAETVGAVPGTEIEQAEKVESFTLDDLTVVETEPAIDTLTPGVEMLLPTREFQPVAPVTKISIKHEPSQTVVAYLNEERVNPLNYDGTETVREAGIAVSRWRGVDLRDGSNRVRVEVRNPDGSTASVLERELHFSGAAVRGEFAEELSVLVADGKTRPVIAVRLFDKYGEPSRPGTVGTFRIDAPYRSWWAVENDRRNQLVSVGSREPIYRVGPDGIALIELEPTTQTGEVTLQLKFDRLRQQEIRTWLAAEPRDWILVGFAEGTVGFKSISDNQIAAEAAGFEDGYFDDGQVAFFAKGKIKGEYLLTLAYDSERDRHERSDRFQTEIDPNAFYPLYADESEQRYEASSQRKLYVKLERKQFFALFGDFDTGLSVTELSRYERRFNGFQIEYQGDNAGYSVFAAETDQSFVRDELRGDGTSGLYQLSSAPIIANSESVFIETRDRFDASEVLSSDKLSRFLDYNLDTIDGTLYFKKPVPSRDGNFNPIVIVVEYESNTSANEDVIAGGRMSLRTTNDRMEIGASHINEGQQGAEADLSGVDIRWQASDTTLVKAEYATSNRNVAGVDQEGSAYQMTVEHRGEKADIRAYVKEVEQNFGLGHQSAAESGIKKAGFDARIRLNEQFVVEGEASVQQNLETGADRNVGRAMVRYENNGFDAAAGISYAEDEFADGQTRTSELAEFGVGQRMFGGRLTVRANGSVGMNEDAENADVPTSLVVGADYRLTNSVDLFAEWEDSSSRDIEATMTRVGVRASPWSRAQVNSSVTNESTEFGPRVFANLGLVQGFQLNEKWFLDVGVDQTNTIVQPDARVFDTDREFVSGSLNEDFLAAYVGAMYNAELWSANTRIEQRNSDTDERMTLLTGWYREPRMGHSLSAGLTLFTSENISGAETAAADLKIGWAYRLAGGQWSFLDRVDLIFEETGLSSIMEDSWRFINNFNANRRLSENSQFSLQYAFKYVKSNFGNLEFSGYTDLIGGDYHRALSPKWNVGAHTSIYHSYESDVMDYGVGASLGYNLRDNMWFTIGYNAFGFDDSDFAAARYTAQGPYIQISIKADQHTLKRIAGQTR